MGLAKPKPRKKNVQKKKHPVKKVIPKQFLLMDPPPIARDPKPMAGLMEFMQKGLHGPVWKERFIVCGKGKLAWYPPECAIEGYVEAQALGSIPIANIFESSVDGEGYLLDLTTERTSYHFRSKQQNEVGRWQDAVMNTSPPGATQYLLKLPEIGGGTYKKNFWDAMGADTGTTKKGGIPFGRPEELLSKDQEVLLQSIFDLIKAQDVTDLKKEHIEDMDVAKFVSNRLEGKDAQLPTMEECTQAIEEAITLGSDNECTFESFKKAICAPRGAKPHGSELARLVELAMQGNENVEEAVQDAAGEMSLGQKLYEYHKFIGNTLRVCRDGEKDEKATDKVTLTKIVAETHCQNVVNEVKALIEKHKQYQQRLHGMQPSLRQQIQHRAIDDVFDNEMLPGRRWEP